MPHVEGPFFDLPNASLLGGIFQHEMLVKHLMSKAVSQYGALSTDDLHALEASWEFVVLADVELASRGHDPLMTADGFDPGDDPAYD